MTWLRRCIIMAFFALRSDILKYKKQLKTFECSSRDVQKCINRQLLLELLTHASQQVPYYRDLFMRLGIFKDGIVDVDRFSEIPILTKDIIREQGERMYADDFRTRAWYENSSGGSTGEPLRIIQDHQYRDASWAMKILYNEWIEKYAGDREVKLWGSERDILQGSETWLARFKNWLYGRTLINSFRMTPEDIAQAVKTINRVKPVTIWAYIDSAYELARYIDQNSCSFYSPRAILVSAGTATPEMKDYIGSVLQAPVYNQYGSRECGDMATECKARDGLHVFESLYVFEILNEKLEPCELGELGYVHVTGLMNKAMPLIRYRIGDTASWKSFNPCKCGRITPRINDVHGRITDHFRRQDGTIVHGEFFTHLFYFKPWVKQFQIRQHKYKHVECLVVQNRLPDESDVLEIIEGIQAVMGSDCEVSFTYVDDIPPSASGKRRFTISTVSA